MERPASWPLKVQVMTGVTSPTFRNRLEGEAAFYKRLLDRHFLRSATDGANSLKRFCSHTFHETRQRYNGLATMDAQISGCRK